MGSLLSKSSANKEAAAAAAAPANTQQTSAAAETSEPAETAAPAPPHTEEAGNDEKYLTTYSTEAQRDEGETVSKEKTGDDSAVDEMPADEHASEMTAAVVEA